MAETDHEALRLIDDAGHSFSRTADAIADIRAVFEAIRAAAPPDSLPSRLTALGMRLCDLTESDLTGLKDFYHASADG